MGACLGLVDVEMGRGKAWQFCSVYLIEALLSLSPWRWGKKVEVEVEGTQVVGQWPGQEPLSEWAQG